MEPEYKAVIGQRRTYLCDHVTWNKKFREKLLNSGILPRDELERLQLDVNPGSRTFKLLARLVQLPQSGVYQALCDILTASGQTQAATLLLQDRDNILWDFDNGARVRSVDDFANVVTDVLLPRLQREEDAYIRGVLGEDVRQRFTRLHRFVQDTMKQHTAFLTHTLHSYTSTPSTLLHLPAPPPTHRPFLVLDDALEGMRVRDGGVGGAVSEAWREVRQEVEAGQARVEQEQQEVCRLQAQVQELQDKLEEKQRQSFHYLQRLIMEQDDTICELRGKLRSTEELVTFSRGDIIQLLSSIRNVCPRAASLPMPAATSPDLTTPDTEVILHHQKDVSPEDALHRHLKALLELVEQLKLRLVQTNNKMADLDKERNVIKTLVNARGSTGLPAVLSKQMRAFREQKMEHMDTIRTLRGRVEELNKEKQGVQQELESLACSLETDVFHPAATATTSDTGEAPSSTNRKTRRKSARGRRQRLSSSKSDSSSSRGEKRLEQVEQADIKTTDMPTHEPSNNSAGRAETKHSSSSAGSGETKRSRETLISQYVNMQTQQ